MAARVVELAAAHEDEPSRSRPLVGAATRRDGFEEAAGSLGLRLMRKKMMKPMDNGHRFILFGQIKNITEL